MPWHPRPRLEMNRKCQDTGARSAPAAPGSIRYGRGALPPPPRPRGSWCILVHPGASGRDVRPYMPHGKMGKMASWARRQRRCSPGAARGDTGARSPSRPGASRPSGAGHLGRRWSPGPGSGFGIRVQDLAAIVLSPLDRSHVGLGPAAEGSGAECHPPGAKQGYRPAGRGHGGWSDRIASVWYIAHPGCIPVHFRPRSGPFPARGRGDLHVMHATAATGAPGSGRDGGGHRAALFRGNRCSSSRGWVSLTAGVELEAPGEVHLGKIGQLSSRPFGSRTVSYNPPRHSGVGLRRDF
jgi:hypothetical protein